MRLVIDTNVFVSASLKLSSWPAVAVRWASTHGGLLKATETELEVLTVLQRPRIAAKLAPGVLQSTREILAAATLVEIHTTVLGCRDPDDNKFLELAVNGSADVIVTGDEDLLVLDVFQTIPIITPATFGQTWARGVL